MISLASGCGTVGRVVVSDTWGTRFESSHEQILYFCSDNCIEKMEIKKKDAGNGPVFLKNIIYSALCCIGQLKGHRHVVSIEVMLSSMSTIEQKK